MLLCSAKLRTKQTVMLYSVQATEIETVKLFEPKDAIENESMSGSKVPPAPDQLV